MANNNTNNTSSTISHRLVTQWLPQILLLAITAHYFWFVYSNAANIPNQDDILDFLAPLVAVDKSDSAANAVSILFEEYNDHRTMASRLVVYAASRLQGEVNFHTLTVVANLALPLLLLLLYVRTRSLQWGWLYLLAGALLLLHVRTFDLTLFSQGAFAYYWVYLYAFAGIFLLHRVTPLRFVLAALACTMASLTLASGQLAWLTGLASLAHQCLLLKNRSWHYLIVWVGISAAALLLWHQGFSFGSAETQITPASMLDLALEHSTPTEVLVRYAKFFLVSLGCALTSTSVTVAAAVGLLLLIAHSVLSLHSLRSADARLALCGWFVVGSAAAVTLGRAALADPSYALTQRYSSLSVMMLYSVTTLALTRLQWRGSALPWLVVVLAGTYSAWSFHQFASPARYMAALRVGPFNAQRYPVFGMSASVTKHIVEEAMERGLYFPPCRPYPQCTTTPAAGQAQVNSP